MGKHVLVVEDNPMNMELVRDLLELAGHDIYECFTAADGIKTAREKHPDLILMDIALPDMDGLEATRVLKSDEAVKDVPVIALTAHAMSGDEDKAMAAGCDGYITKPIDARSFAQTLEAYLAPSRSA